LARILVTGVAGFIASRTAELLLDEGHLVVGLDDLNETNSLRMKQARLAVLEGRPGFSFARADVADRAALAAALPSGSFDAVINLAARAGVRTSVENPWIYVATNVTGTLNLLALCQERAIPKFVLASTSSVYGDSRAELFREEDESSRPMSPYAATKKAAEVLAHTWHALHGLDVSVLRYFTVYGPASRPDMATFRFVQRISEGRPITVYGDGSMSRDFTYVDDVARGTIAALRPLGYEIVNLGGDHPYAVRELVAAIEAATGKRAEVRHAPAHPADVPRTAASIAKARRLLGWEPRIGLAQGAERSVAWYAAHRAWAKDIPTDS
jgi:nucleoside-diphosphate-sugar epimerase